MIDLKAFRRKNKLKQTDISEVTGIDQSRISKYEKGFITDYVTDKLLEHYPELEDYRKESNVVNEPIAGYQKEEYAKLMELIGLKETIINLRAQLDRIEKVLNPKKEE